MDDKVLRRPFQKTLTVVRWALWFLVLGLVVQPIWNSHKMEAARTEALEHLQRERKSRVIAMIHGEETVSVLGIPVSRYISMQDSEAILRAIRLTPAKEPIDLILHTPGGLELAAEQIARALVDRKSPVTVFVPHYAMSGGTLIALAADKIVMDPNAVLGPVDPQIGGMPAASILKAVATKPRAHISDQTLILADVAAKAQKQIASLLTEILQKHFPKDKAAALALPLSDGRWTHDFPITVQAARNLGLSVSTDVPELVYELMALHPQGQAVRPSVLYIPFRPSPQEGPSHRTSEIVPDERGP
jgi:ClpP class serine protease